MAEAELWEVNRSLCLSWEADQLVASPSSSRASFPLVPEFVPLLECFSKPTTVEDGVTTFLARFETDGNDGGVAGEVSATVQRFIEAGALMPTDGSATPSTGWYARAEGHILMLSDQNRTLSYRSVLQRHAPDKVVLEIGCGSGVLACFAADAGAKHVYAVEESAIIETAQQIAEANGLADRITFLTGNSMDIELPERVDVVYSELIGTDALGELPMLSILADASERHMKRGGLMIPKDITLLGLAVESPAFAAREELFQSKHRTAEELSHVYGLDLTPLTTMYDRELAARAQSPEEIAIGESISYEPRDWGIKILSPEAHISSFELGEPIPKFPAEVSVTLDVTATGYNNAILMYFKSQLDNRCELNSGPYSPQNLKNWRQMLVPINPATVAAGDTMKIRAAIDPQAYPTVEFGRP